jgi:DNA-binding NtrC family response regulator
MVGTKRTVLIIDDDPEVRDTFVTLLSLEHYVVRLAENRERALEILAYGEPDVVLLDWFMPGMPVEEFVLKARAKYPHLQMVLLSASLNTKHKARELKITHSLTKPVDVVDVVKAIDQCIQQRKRL